MIAPSPRTSPGGGSLYREEIDNIHWEKNGLTGFRTPADQNIPPLSLLHCTYPTASESLTTYFKLD